MILPSLHDRNSLCLRKNSHARSMLIRYVPSFPVALAYSVSPHSGIRLSWKDEWSASGLWSQFQPPSDHCHLTSPSARDLTLESSASPSREQLASAFPSIEAWTRAIPSTVKIPVRCLSLDNQSNTCSAFF